MWLHWSLPYRSTANPATDNYRARPCRRPATPQGSRPRGRPMVETCAGKPSGNKPATGGRPPPSPPATDITPHRPGSARFTGRASHLTHSARGRHGPASKESYPLITQLVMMAPALNGHQLRLQHGQLQAPLNEATAGMKGSAIHSTF